MSSVKSHNLSLQCQRFTPSGCTGLGILTFQVLQKKNLNPQIPLSVILAKCYTYKMLLVKNLQYVFSYRDRSSWTES